MKTDHIKIAFLVSMSSILLSCSNDAIYNNIVQLNYGTSFGECMGYCKHDVTIKSNKATFNCYSWNTTMQTLTKTDTIKSDALDSIYSMNTKSFFNLSETIGCPDCADGGAEWIEIELTNGNKHKVTFEYSHEPTILKDQIKKLRELLSINGCN